MLSRFCWIDFQNAHLTSNLYSLNLNKSLDRNDCNLRLFLQITLHADSLKTHIGVKWFSFF